MLFWLKKTGELFLLPLPMGLFLIIIGLLIYRARRISIVCRLIGFLIILVFSLWPTANFLINPLQSQYSPLLNIPTTVSKVVVLGGGVSGGKNYPPNIRLASASLSRLIEGIRVFKVLQTTNPNTQLILSGGRVFQSPAVAGKMGNTAEILGVDRKNIVLEDGSTDTHQEAVFLRKTLGENPFILVTSAYHMPRAMALFKALHMHPIAAPTQFIGTHTMLSSWFIPDAGALTSCDTAIHEYLGIWWARLRGYIEK